MGHNSLVVVVSAVGAHHRRVVGGFGSVTPNRIPEFPEFQWNSGKSTEFGFHLEFLDLGTKLLLMPIGVHIHINHNIPGQARGLN